MGKRDDLIAQYADDLKNKCGMTPDMDLLTKVTIGCGPAIYNADASTVAGSQPAELETVKNNFLIKKLGLSDSPQLMEAINSCIAMRLHFGRACLKNISVRPGRRTQVSRIHAVREYDSMWGSKRVPGFPGGRGPSFFIGILRLRAQKVPNRCRAI